MATTDNFTGSSYVEDAWMNPSPSFTPPKSQRNYGADVYFHTGNNLLRFILSSIPSNAVCISATLSLFKYSTGTIGSGTVNFYPIKSANGDWIPGTHNDTLAAAGENCWDSKKADGSGGVTEAWAGSAGCSTSGTDYDASSAGNFSYDRSEIQYTEKQASLDTTTVQSWFGSASNNGLLVIISSPYSDTFCSTNFATADYRPILTVTYEVPASGIPKHFMYYQRLRSL